MSNLSTLDPADTVLLMNRTFQAPRELVWKAWTDPEMMKQWICPHNFTVIEVESDLQVGGSWRSGMRHLDGDEYYMKGIYKEIDPPRRLVMTHVWEDDSEPGHDPARSGLISIDLVELNGKTLMTFRHEGLPTLEARDEHRIGWNGAFDHLNDFVLRQISETSEREITLSRTFAAPRDLVYDIWTKPEHITHWYGPDGFTTTTHEMDVRVGGIWRFTMHGPDGTDYPNRITYEEVDPTVRLVFQHSDDQPDGGIYFHVTVDFQEDDGETTVTMRSVFPSAEALQAVMKFGVVEGGRQTLARFGAYLAERRNS